MEKRKATREPKQDKKQRRGATRDPNQPKRPPSAFFVFMEDFRKSYKEKHPDVKSVSIIGKAGGNKWSAMSDEEKAPFVSIAADRKAEYERSMAAYRNKESQGNREGDSNEEESGDE